MNVDRQQTYVTQFLQPLLSGHPLLADSWEGLEGVHLISSGFTVFVCDQSTTYLACSMPAPNNNSNTLTQTGEQQLPCNIRKYIEKNKQTKMQGETETTW